MHVQLKFLNAVYMKIEADRSVLMSLEEKFTYYAKNFKFMPAYKNGWWDGKIRLLDVQKGTCYVGLFKMIYEACKGLGYTVSMDDELKEILLDEPVDTKEFIKGLSIPKDKTPREYQHETLGIVAKYYRALILSATGSGKSLSIYLTLRWLIDQNPDIKIMMIVPTVNLVKQMISDFKEYSSINGWDVDANVYGVYTGQEKLKNCPVMISTWQTAVSFKNERHRMYDAVVVDEVHLAPGKSIRGILDKCTNAFYRIGFTGSLDESETNEITLTGMFGKKHTVAVTSDLIDAGHLADITINGLILKYPDHIRQQIAPQLYQEEIQFITTFAPRTEFIGNLISKVKGNVLVLATKIDHCRALFEMAQLKAPDKKIFLVNGTETDGPDLGVKKKEYSEAVRKFINENDDCVLVASYGLMSTGTNIPRLHAGILASPYKSRVKVLQSIGRYLRIASDKDSVVVYDVVDDLGWKKRQNHCMKHFMERARLYSEEGFEIRMQEISISDEASNEQLELGSI